MSKAKKKITTKLIEVEIQKKGYGKNLLGKKVYFEGYEDYLKTDDEGNTKLKFVDKLGAFTMGKNILESLERNLKKYKVIFTKNRLSSIKKRNGSYTVYIADSDYSKMKKDAIDENADVKNGIIIRKFSALYPKSFATGSTSYYRSGTIERIVPKNCKVSLSLGDKDRVRGLYSQAILGALKSKTATPNDIAREKAIFQLSTLEAYADDLEQKIKKIKDENEWQRYLREHILNLKEEYIAKEEKINISIGRTSLPDFFLISQDNFLDVLEIKTPFTPLVSYDKQHDNYYLSPDVNKAIAQTEKYLDEVSAHGFEIEKFLSKNLKLPLGVIRPGGLIIVGSEQSLDEQADPEKAKSHFRRLRNTLRNIRIITFTELLSGLRNRITILKQLGMKPSKSISKSKKKPRKTSAAKKKK